MVPGRNSNESYESGQGEQEGYENENEDYNGNEDDLELSVEIRDEILISKALHHSEIHAEEEKGEEENIIMGSLWS